MSSIDDLIAMDSPDGVPFAGLGEIGDFIRGRRFTKQDYVDEGLGAIHYGEIYTVYGTSAAAAKSFVRPELKSSLRLAKPGDLVIAATGENLKDVCKAVAWLGDDEIAIHDDCYIFRHRLEPKYVSYFFQSSAFRDQKVKLASESKVVRVSAGNMAKIKIPVPPLRVQREIVRVLDAFESLEAELEAELEARLCQYEHYRQKLLTFTDSDGVRRLPLSELTESIGSGANKARLGEGEYPVYGSTGLLGYCNHAPYSGDALLVARVGANAGRVNAVSGNFDVSDNTLVVWPAGDWDVRFAFHQLTQLNLNRFAVGGGQPLVTGGLLKRLEVPVPSLNEQKRIAAILDKFDALVNDLSIGLPAELNARRKQYEHYRDRLLTFQEAA